MRFFVSPMRLAGWGVGAVLLAVLASAPAGCGQPAATPDAIAADIAGINQRLQGSWRLNGYTPDVALEPMLAMWLTGAQRSLVIRFDGGSLQADAPNQAFAFHYDRPFTISNVAGNNFTLTTVTQNGDALVSYCQLDPQNQGLQFHSQTEPFRGSGVLVRTGP
jgi:hypothetical protein